MCGMREKKEPSTYGKGNDFPLWGVIRNVMKYPRCPTYSSQFSAHANFCHLSGSPTLTNSTLQIRKLRHREVSNFTHLICGKCYD